VSSHTRNLGAFGEDPLERMHNFDNQQNRIFSNMMKTFERSEDAKARRRSTGQSADVQAILTGQKTRSARNFSEESKAKRQRDVDEDDDVC
jgi:hypothetical protein